MPKRKARNLSAGSAVKKYHNAVASSPALELPLDCVSVILQHLNIRDICRCAIVCRTWQAAASDSLIWTNIFRKQWLVDPPLRPSAQVSIQNTVRTAKARDMNLLSCSGVYAHRISTRALAVDPIRNIVYSAGRDDCIRVWDVNKLQRGGYSALPRVKEAHTAAVVCLHYYCAKQQLLFSGAGRSCNSAKLWNCQSGEPQLLHTYTGHVDAVFAVQGSKQLNLLATGGGQDDKTLMMFDIDTGVSTMTVDHRGSVRAVRFGHGPYAHCVITGSLDKGVRLIDVRSQAVQTVSAQHKAGVHSVTVVDEHYVISTSGRSENETHISDMRISSGALLSRLVGHKSAVSCCVYDHCTDSVVSGSYDGTLRVYSNVIATSSSNIQQKSIAVIVSELEIEAVVQTADGRIVSGHNASKIRPDADNVLVWASHAVPYSSY
eukprot:TRINITY_DN13863_c0_g1_i1.p1 TRINITY_DN13863_c0_g1~~TRINITY_DN13863_c0_g1_i1.p1  ORF type:complete len:433 (-),score=95.11 TRINITY_DN13863_c0_g1_i1:6-1304(-)